MSIDARGRVIVRGSDTTLTVTPALDTNAYTAADCLFAITEIPNAAVLAGDTITLMSLSVVDKDSQGQPIDLHFFSGSVSFGAANGSVALSDADSAKWLGRASIGTANYSTCGDTKVACVPLVGLPLTTNGTASLWVGGVSGTPTHTASGLKFLLGVIR